MYKLINIDESEILSKLEYLGSWENSNRLPTPFKRITKNEFEKLFFTYNFDYTEYRQGYVGKSKKWHNMQIFYTNTFAIAVLYNYNTKNYIKTYYRIGCEHNWVTTAYDTLEYTYVCSKCGVKRIVPTGR